MLSFWKFCKDRWNQISYRLRGCKEWVLLIAGGMLFCVVACGRSGPDAAQQAAAQSLESVQALATDETYRRLGFESMDELSNLTLGAPFPVYFIGLDALKSFGEQQNAETLLAESTKKLYPVHARGKVRTSVSLEKKGDQWQTVNFGRPSLVKKLDIVRTTLAEKHDRDPADYFLVSIPSIYLMCVGYREDGEIKLAPLAKHEMLGLDTEEPMPAHQLFAHLSERLSDFTGALPKEH